MSYMDLGDLGEGAPVPRLEGWEKCECGGLKALGIGPLVAGHSHWCPWSLSEFKVNGGAGTIPWYCECSTCMKPAGICAISSGRDEFTYGPKGTVHWYCVSCWPKFPQGMHGRSWPVSRP